MVLNAIIGIELYIYFVPQDIGVLFIFVAITAIHVKFRFNSLACYSESWKVLGHRNITCNFIQFM
ncbi:hypothetical protein D3C72_2460760 [compost metagenome]